MRTGLGTDIVRALARQLDASIEVAAQYPGTRVSIHHTPVALVQRESETSGESSAQAGAAFIATSGNG